MTAASRYWQKNASSEEALESGEQNLSIVLTTDSAELENLSDALAPYRAHISSNARESPSAVKSKRPTISLVDPPARMTRSTSNPKTLARLMPKNSTIAIVGRSVIPPQKR